MTCIAGTIKHYINHWHSYYIFLYQLNALAVTRFSIIILMGWILGNFYDDDYAQAVCIHLFVLGVFFLIYAIQMCTLICHTHI